MYGTFYDTFVRSSLTFFIVDNQKQINNHLSCFVYDCVKVGSFSIKLLKKNIKQLFQWKISKATLILIDNLFNATLILMENLSSNVDRKSLQ